jgi:hypothetical protein
VPPIAIEDQWLVATPESVGLDPKPAKPEPNRDFERTPPSVVRAIFG